MKKYDILVNPKDYNLYAVIKAKTTLHYWHNYQHLNITLLPGDILTFTDGSYVVATGLVKATCIQNVSISNSLPKIQSFIDPNSYFKDALTFEKYYKNCQGNFVLVDFTPTPSCPPYTKQLINHSICKS